MDRKDPFLYVNNCLSAPKWNVKCKFEYNIICIKNRFHLYWSCSKRALNAKCCDYVCPWNMYLISNVYHLFSLISLKKGFTASHLRMKNSSFSIVIRHLHISHNAPCLPPKMLHITAIIPMGNEKQRLCNIFFFFLGGGGAQIRCIMGDVQVPYSK